jgi:hypothetical protein
LNLFKNNYRINNLPDAWKTQDWPTFLDLCQDYYNSVKPNFSECKNLSSENIFDREADQKKVREWFINPVKFNKAIENEQCHHPNKCIYHLSKTHPTHDCVVKKECDQILETQKKNTSQQLISSLSTGQLCHVTEELYVDNVPDELQDSEFVIIGNDTNKDTLLYLARISKH